MRHEFRLWSLGGLWDPLWTLLFLHLLERPGIVSRRSCSSLSCPMKSNHRPARLAILGLAFWAQSCAGELLPEITVPDAFESILNVHFKTVVTPESDIAEATPSLRGEHLHKKVSL